MTWLMTFITAHTVTVAIALFMFLSQVLNAVAVYLQSIGDKVPPWMSTVTGWLSSIIHFINGNLAAASAPAPTSPQS